MEIGELVRMRIRERMGYVDVSQNKLAKKAQISQSGLSSILNGQSSPQIDTLARIADALGVSIIELLVDDSEELPSEELLWKDNSEMLSDLTPQELQRVMDFIHGIKSAKM